ncbi:MAG: DUF1343 domain-containing protein [Acidobacteria bacterium]|nr:DUF1343 domain-containing protein [Acidobacteriota bacterium]
MSVVPGIEVLCGREAGLLRGARVGLIAHPASVTRGLAHAAEALAVAGARVVRLFAPEHGSGGGAQDMVAVDERRDALTGLPVVSLYGDDEASLTPTDAALAGLDLLVADLADVGARYYTFYATIVRALGAAARAGLRVVVCDRPNPLGGVLIEGNLVGPGYRSFVGELPVPNRHGMTVGELCRFAAVERGLELDLTVVPCAGWSRAQWWDATGLPWVLPSPNMPTLETATVYPGMCLVEGTNLSEGRGTTRPFELAGAPWLDGRALAAQLERWGLPGVAFRPVRFRPAFQKHAGSECQGVQLHVTDRLAFRPVLTGVAFLAAARAQDPARFRWRTEPYEFVSDRPAIDLLAGGPGWREAIETGVEPAVMAAAWAADEAAFARIREPSLLYPP